MTTVKNILLHSITIVTFLYSLSNAWPLDSAFNRGDNCISISWTPDSANTDPSWYIRWGTQCTGADTVYLHSDFIPGRAYNGVAYSYGGEDPWNLFRARIDSGYPAGSHLCHYREYGDPSDTITGTDCSGYLCFIWNVPRMSTDGLVQSSRFIHINKTDLRAGDALVRGGYHCVFVAEADDPSEIVIWEASSSVFGCRERVTDINTSYWAPYTALRYPEITKIKKRDQNKGHPAPGFFSIQALSHGRIAVYSACITPITFTVYNTQGQLLDKVTIPGYTQSFEFASTKLLGGGIYLVTVSNNNHVVYKKRIVLYH